MSVTSFLVYEDPSNSWIKVKKSTIKFYFGKDWRKYFTSFSYERGFYVYLESTKDAPTFVNKMRKMGVEPTFRKQMSKKLSRIRNYDCLAPIDLG